MASDWQAFRDSVSAAAVTALPEHIARLQADAPTVGRLQQAGLRRLLEHAVAHSGFHQRRLSGVDLAQVTPTDLSALPAMTKDEMMSSLDDVFTDPRLTRERVEAALAATDDTPVPIDGEFLALATGGSSGRRAIIVYDRAGLVGYSCSLTRSMAARIQQLTGDAPIPSIDIAMVTAATAKHASQAMSHIAAASLPLRFHHIPATLPLPEIVARLNALQPLTLMGYASMVYRLAAERRIGRLRINPMSVSATSETLDERMRTAISDTFGIPVTNTFGSTEGLTGSSPADSDAIVFNTDLCIVELVDDAYQPVPFGTPSSRVLITNLYNLAQPLIRYEITDRFQAVANPDGTGHLAALVHGRADDVLRYGEVEIHPHAVTSVMVAAREVEDYQVRQTAAGLDVRIVAGPAFDEAELAHALTTSLARAGLENASVDIHIVEELQRDERTGKVRRFIGL